MGKTGPLLFRFFDHENVLWLGVVLIGSTCVDKELP